jgi:predicted anti-sigma-YlaC factor YlaD
MSACKKYRDIILTDHMDGELDKSAQARVAQHLAVCPGCRALAEQVKQDMVLPFEQAGREAVPEHVWTSIKEKIEKESHTYSFAFPKLAPALMSVAALVLVGSLMFHDQQIKQAKAQAQSEYLISVLAPANGAASETDSEDTPTPIETYFL